MSAVFLAIIGAQAFAGPFVAEIPKVGPHYVVLTVEKSIHPQNVLVAYTKLDDDCRLVRDPNPLFDFYWLMDRVRYKRVNWLIKRGIRKRLEVEADSTPVSGANVFRVRLNELDEVENDLGSPVMTVRAEKSAEGCKVEADIQLGPSDNNAVLRLDSIHSEAEMTGHFTAKVESITLIGTDAQTHHPLSRTYRAKPPTP